MDLKLLVSYLVAFVFWSCTGQGNRSDTEQSGTADAAYFQSDSLALRSFDAYKGDPKVSIGKQVLVDSAAVSCAHPEATKVGVDILKKGGNAVDAAIAIQLALAVVYPKAGNIGGGGFMVAHLADGKNFTFDYREKAPAKASRDMYLDAKGNVIENLSISGHKACGVPGTVDGLITAHQYGRLPFKDLIQPAIDLAKNGFHLTRRDATHFNKYRDDFMKINKHRPNIVKETGKWQEDELYVQNDLANTLLRIRDQGRDGFYKGKTAAAILAEMKAGGGLITQEDLDNYHTQSRTPLEFDYKDYHLISMGPPSSGGTCLAQIMGMIEDKNLGQFAFHSAEAVHLMTEAERRAYADRAEHLGDPDFWKVPKGLTDKAYLKKRFADYDPKHATPSSKVKAGVFHESNETTHISVMDADGNCVSVTTTLNSNYGSKVEVKGAGFILNNEMDDFSVKPGVPNQFGLVGGDANAIAPNKRMLSAMTPTIVLKGNKPFMVVGTPGGATIITSVFQVLMNVIEFKMDLQHAVDAPRMHHQWLPDKISMELNALPADVIKKLKAMGYTLDVRESIGLVDAIMVRKDGKIEGVGDRRSDDTAAGY